MAKVNFEFNGGRCLEDIEQYWFGIMRELKDMYPINEVPGSMVAECTYLKEWSEELVKRGRIFIEKMNEVANGQG